VVLGLAVVKTSWFVFIITIVDFRFPGVFGVESKSALSAPQRRGLCAVGFGLWAVGCGPAEKARLGDSGYLESDSQSTSSFFKGESCSVDGTIRITDHRC
jgi:hypothetical protein